MKKQLLTALLSLCSIFAFSQPIYGPDTICSGVNISYLIISTGAPSYTWSVPSGSTITSGQGTTSIRVTMGVNSGTVSVTPSGSGTISKQIFVKRTPHVTISSASSRVCLGSSLILHGHGALTYNWYPSYGLSATNLDSTIASPGHDTTYYLIGDSLGCVDTTSIHIIVDSLPSVSVTASDTVICSGDSVWLCASGANTYTWSPSTGLRSTTDTCQYAHPTTTTTYTVIGVGAHGCVNSKSITIRVKPKPNVSISSSSSHVCKGSTATLSISGGHTYYTWSPSTGLNTTIGNPVIATIDSTITYKVVGDTLGCKDSSTITIIVDTLPNVNIYPSDTSICVGDTVTLTATGGVSYTWSPSTGLNSTTGSTVIAHPTSTTIYTVVATGSNGCTNSKKIRVQVGIELHVKAFIQGLYRGSSTMTAAPYNADGISPDTIADTITIELHSPISPYNTIFSQRTLLSIHGLATVTLPCGLDSDYIVIKHRNSIETWSAHPVTMIFPSTYYDFSIAASQAYGDNEVDDGYGVYLIYTGDINQDGSIDFNDYPQLNIDAGNGAVGYLSTDINGDAAIDFGDYPTIDTNSSNGIITMRP
jgi:hypothetical protein